MQGGTNSSEFRIPDSELEGSVELRVPSPQPSRLTPVPSDKILFPRRMLYVEAVLYVTVAATAFGLGYLAGRGGSSAADKEAAERARCGCRSRARCCWRAHGREAGRRGGRRHCLARRQVARQAAADRRSAARRSAAGRGRRHVWRAGRVRRRRGPGRASGYFALFVPAAGSYRILIISRQATREPNGPPEQGDLSELGKYFDVARRSFAALPLSLADEGSQSRRQADRRGDFAE